MYKYNWSYKHQRSYDRFITIWNTIIKDTIPLRAVYYYISTNQIVLSRVEPFSTEATQQELAMVRISQLPVELFISHYDMIHVSKPLGYG